MKAAIDRQRILVAPALAACALLAVGATAADDDKNAPAAPAELDEQAEATDSFEFDTGQLTGRIRTDGAYHGVSRLTLKSNGRQVIDERYSALNLFKLMSANQVMGQPRHMERVVSSNGDSTQLEWPPDEGHAGTVTARYEIRPPDAVDVVVTVESKGSYSGYEVFMSSYFDQALRPNVHLQSRGNREPEWVVPRFNEVFKNTLLTFPRDAHAARLCIDGRWDRDERKTPTIQLTPARHYASALAIMTDPADGTAVALMAKPEHVYAISTRYFSENPEERNTSYSAFDFALFGDDFDPGDRRSVRVRLVLTTVENGDLESLEERYRLFLDEEITDANP